MTTPMRSHLSYADVARKLDAIADRTQPSRTFDLLVRMLRLNDRKIEARSGISRQTINGKRSGASPIRARDGHLSGGGGRTAAATLAIIALLAVLVCGATWWLGRRCPYCVGGGLPVDGCPGCGRIANGVA